MQMRPEKAAQSDPEAEIGLPKVEWTRPGTPMPYFCFVI